MKSKINIDLLFLKRKNSQNKYSKEVRQLLFKVKSKSILGFINRTSIKVLAIESLFLINKLMGNADSMAKIKRLEFGWKLQILISIKTLFYILNNGNLYNIGDDT